MWSNWRHEANIESLFWEVEEGKSCVWIILCGQKRVIDIFE